MVVTSVRKVSHAVTSTGASSFLSKLGGVLKQGAKNVVNIVVDGSAHLGAAMLGAANASSSNQLLGVGRINALKHGLTDSKGVAFQLGQKAGDAVSVVTGVLEWGASGVAEVASLGWATPVAIPVAAHGTSAIGMGLYNLINGQIVYSTSKENTGGSSSGSSNSPKKYSSEPPTENAVKLKNGQGWKDKDGNFWRKDMKHKDHWDVTDSKTGKKVKEVDFDGNQIWPNGPKNKNKT